MYKLSDLEEMQKKNLKVGRNYTIYQDYLVGKEKKWIPVKMKCIGIYPHIAEFANKHKIRRSYTYADLWIMKKRKE